MGKVGKSLSSTEMFLFNPPKLSPRFVIIVYRAGLELSYNSVTEVGGLPFMSLTRGTLFIPQWVRVGLQRGQEVGTWRPPSLQEPALSDHSSASCPLFMTLAQFWAQTKESRKWI